MLLYGMVEISKDTLFSYLIKTLTINMSICVKCLWVYGFMGLCGLGLIEDVYF